MVLRNDKPILEVLFLEPKMLAMQAMVRSEEKSRHYLATGQAHLSEPVLEPRSDLGSRLLATNTLPDMPEPVALRVQAGTRALRVQEETVAGKHSARVLETESKSSLQVSLFR
jgi:hypothetical protein